MPRANQKSSAGLSIQLSEDRKFYTPGSTISGNVTLNTTQDFAIGSVHIDFYGRAKVHFVQDHGQGNRSVWRGRSPLFSESHLLHSGYHTQRPGTFSWPFVLELPLNPDIVTVQDAKHQWANREHYRCTEDGIPSPMPPTFEFRKRSFGYQWHAFVEYVIKVSVREAPGASIFLPPSSRKAVLPIVVRDVANPEQGMHSLPPAIHYSQPEQHTEKTWTQGAALEPLQLQHQARSHTIRSSRLHDPAHHQGPLAPSRSQSISKTIRDKSKAVFSPNSLPRFTFEVTVSVPESIQLLEKHALSFIVTLKPVQDQNLTTVQPESYPDVRVDNVSLYLRTSTYIRFKGIWSDRVRNTCSEIRLLERHPVDVTINMESSNHSSKSVQEHHESSKASTWSGGIDLSELPGFAMTLVSARIGLQTEEPLSQTFSTCIIAREYSLQWRLELEVAGEKVRVSNRDKLPVRVLPPKAENLNLILNGADATKAGIDDEDCRKGGSEADSTEIVADRETKAGLRKLRHKNKKQEAVTEDVAVSDFSYQRSQHPIHSEQGMMLPSHEQYPVDFGYRHEIDEQPPRYKRE